MEDFKPKTTKVKQGSWIVFHGLCKGCGICLEKCPSKALTFGKDLGIYSTPTPVVDSKKCNLCQICEICCPDSAITALPEPRTSVQAVKAKQGFKLPRKMLAKRLKAWGRKSRLFKAGKLIRLDKNA